ncbi:PREDICTED: F-box protein ETP1-like [Camelina sativa]|uniref:F-box protein ETP1-like n=1 Tax=Camelina sativa TaxID=90675 RepID=A0ABM1RU09_CAMSA|nr:PREDICTED: F-box protein ETP1-like [Camelina sativa]XP_019102492.1 PREDICTED: F-box protein ETP1-like [Camelina sativa]XP_019102494.1 PREDICTED: F-box protein ETP1-like [Camelina sativa]XP_019102495.1 PREDICTED: F-box protein ETP1-like [Camelina sativa]XP_019102497.1 PREDICTED: F-box protein ETP1-like [Camelina sativa]
MAVPELLNDLVDEILCRVPATSLKRLRATCKRWNRLFKDDRRFAREHFDNAPKEIHSLILTEKCRICPLSIINLRPHGDDVPPLPSVEVKRELSVKEGTRRYGSQIVVWNPFTGQTRWIEANNRWKNTNTFVLGYYNKKNNKSSCSQRSYKILCYNGGEDTEIYDLNSSDSWRRIPDGDLTPPGWDGMIAEDIVPLKGNTYFFAKEKSKPHLGWSLLKFDFSAEKSSLFVPLPYQCPRYKFFRLSVVRDEKLSVFLQPDSTCKTEIWVTSKIDNASTKTVSWNNVLAFNLSPHLQITDLVNFVLDEDKKVAVCCDRWIEDCYIHCIDKIFILRENNQVSESGCDPLVTHQT